MRLSEIEQYKILNSIWHEAREKANFNDNGKIEYELRLGTNSNNDTEIFIKKGFMKMYAFRVYRNNEFTFYERWNHYPNRILSREFLVSELIRLIK